MWQMLPARQITISNGEFKNFTAFLIIHYDIQVSITKLKPSISEAMSRDQ